MTGAASTEATVTGTASTTTGTVTGPSNTTGPTSEATTMESSTTGPGTTTTTTTGGTTGPDETTGAGSSSTGSTTGGDPLGCGDGIVEALEECDDGNMVGGDGCDAKCEYEFMIAFVSSVSYSGSGMVGAIGGDAKCMQLAKAQPALKGRTFVAWLSTGMMDAEGRIGFTDRKYLLTDMKTKVADDTVDLLDGSLDAAIRLTEAKADIGSGVAWTGTTPSGLAAADHCSGWSVDGVLGAVGDRTATDGGWTQNGTSMCNLMRPIYCIQKPK